MRSTTMLWVVATGVLVTLPSLALAQENEGEDRDAPRRPALRERVLRTFDEDGDGRLNEREVDAVREQLGERLEGVRERVRELREQRSEDRERQAQRRTREAEQRPQGDRDRDAEPGEQDRRGRERQRRPNAEREPDRDRGPDRDRNPEARVRGERSLSPEDVRRRVERARERRDSVRVERRVRIQSDRGPDGPPRPGRPRGPIGPTDAPSERNLQPLFGWFDADGDNVLSRREFAELSQFVERRRPGRPDGPGDGPRVSRGMFGGAGGFGEGGFRGFGGPGFRRFPDGASRFDPPPRSDRPNASNRPRERAPERSDRDRPSRPPRPGNPPEPTEPPEPDRAPSDAI